MSDGPQVHKYDVIIDGNRQLYRPVKPPRPLWHYAVVILAALVAGGWLWVVFMG